MRAWGLRRASRNLGPGGACRAEAIGGCHDRVAVSLACLAYGRTVPGGLSDRRALAQAALEVVSAYVDQKPENDLSRKRSEEFGFPIYPSIAEALRCGGKEIAVDAVLIIGEHGATPRTNTGRRSIRATSSSSR